MVLIVCLGLFFGLICCKHDYVSKAMQSVRYSR